MSDIEQDIYTNQTILSLSRSFLETIIENRTEAVILLKIRETKDFQNLLNRLKYTDIKVYSYSENIDDFKNIELNVPVLENDEFFLIAAERFSACLYWNRTSIESFDLCKGFCSLNPSDTKQIIEYLQKIKPDQELEKSLSQVLQDRRNNEKFTTILRKIVSDLENRQRELICANSELKEFYEKKEESEKLSLLGQLFSTVMHEVRNPLGAINLHTKIIAKKLKLIETDNQEAVKDILDAVDLITNTSLSLEKTLSELLDYSKPLVLNKTELNFENAVQEIINLIRPTYENKSVKLIFENTLNKGLLVSFDRAKFHQVIFNILKNALEVSKSGDKVRILLQNQEDKIYLKISDEGPGISEKNREKIFEPYFTTKKEGTGVGLAHAKKIITAHGGEIYVEPNNEQGSTFIISLPVNQYR